MNHQELWDRLREEMHYLINQQVKSIDLHIILGYMGFLEEIEEHKDKQGKEAIK